MTNFNWLLDGSIVGVYLLATMVAGLMVRKYVSKVDHFLVAGREMNVYLGIASLAATEFGIITCMYTAQAGYNHGFAGAWPGICLLSRTCMWWSADRWLKPRRRGWRGSAASDDDAAHADRSQPAGLRFFSAGR